MIDDSCHSILEIGRLNPAYWLLRHVLGLPDAKIRARAGISASTIIRLQAGWPCRNAWPRLLNLIDEVITDAARDASDRRDGHPVHVWRKSVYSISRWVKSQLNDEAHQPTVDHPSLPPPTRPDARRLCDLIALHLARAGGRAAAHEVAEALKTRGFKKARVYRAARRMKLERATSGFGPDKRCVWTLPEAPQ